MINALCAIAVGIQNNIPAEKILEGISEFELTKNRMEIVDGKTGTKIINDSYNANYDSMKAALQYLSNVSSDKKIAILGNMGELGDFTEEMHNKVGEEVYHNKIDILITVGDSARYIANKAIMLGMDKYNVFMCDTNEEAVKKANELMKEGDCILVKASNSMNFKEIVERLKNN